MNTTCTLAQIQLHVLDTVLEEGGIGTTWWRSHIMGQLFFFEEADYIVAFIRFIYSGYVGVTDDKVCSVYGPGATKFE